MAYPYGPQDVIPFGMLQSPEDEFDMSPEAMGMADLQAPQEALPQDFWARVAQGSGPQPFSFQAGPRPTGLEVLLALASGIGNVKARQGAQRVSETQQRNTQAREAAKTLATWRHQERLAKQAREDARLAAREAREAKPPPKTPEQIREEAEARAAGTRAGAPPIAPTRNPIVGFDPETGDRVFLDPVTMQPRGGGVVPAAPMRQMPEKMRVGLLNDSQIVAQVGDIYRLYNKTFVGPIAGGLGGGIRAKTGKGMTKEEAKFRSSVATYVNKARNLLYGAALTGFEIGEAMKQFPDPGQPSEVFEANLELTRQNVMRAAEWNRSVAERQGFNLAGLPPLGGAAPSAGGGPDDKVRIIRNGVRGTVSRKFLKPTDQVIE